MEKNKRIVWVDYAKVLCIFFVTLVHTPIYRPVYDVLCAFIIPMFFFLSGYFFSYDRYPDYWVFIKRRVRQLLVPYFSLATIAYVFWFFVGRHYGNDAELDISWYSPLVATIMGWGKEMVQSVPLWFVMALFTLEIIFWPIGRYVKNSYILLLIFVALGYVEVYYVDVKLPFYINHALVGLIFYFIGMLFHRIDYKRLYSYILLPVGAIALWIAVSYNEHVTFLIEKFGNYWYFLLGGLGGIAIMIAICNILADVTGDLAFVRYIGKNTIVICGLHLVMFTLIKGIMVYILNIPLTVLDNFVVPCLIMGAVSIVFCLPVIYVLEKYFPYLLGRIKS